MFHCLPDSAWSDGNLAEAAGQDGGTQKPGLSSLGTPCRHVTESNWNLEPFSKPIFFVLNWVPGQDDLSDEQLLSAQLLGLACGKHAKE